MFHGDCERFCLSFEKQSNDTTMQNEEREKQSKNDRKTHIPDII